MLIQCPQYISIQCSYSLLSYNFCCEFDAEEFHEIFPYIGAKELFAIDAGNTTIEILVYENSTLQRPMLLDLAVRLRGIARGGIDDLIRELVDATETKSRSFKLMSGDAYRPVLHYDQRGGSVLFKISDQIALYSIDLGGCLLFLDEDEELCCAAFQGVQFNEE
jgi:hypothetical protein